MTSSISASNLGSVTAKAEGQKGKEKGKKRRGKGKEGEPRARLNAMCSYGNPRSCASMPEKQRGREREKGERREKERRGAKKVAAIRS